MFSLVTPTYNRAPILKRMLAHLFQLDRIQDCEVIIVNDGSTDGTAAVLAEFQQRFPTLLRVIETTNGGPARARNQGVSAAAKDRILFIDDDVFPRQGMLESHWRLLESGCIGSQGILLWHSDISITPLIRYIDSRGSQFAFDRVKDPENLGFAHVYTGNFAVEKSAVIAAGGFDEAFFTRKHGFSAFEDTILGYNLIQYGARLALNRDAIADHLHDMAEEGYFHREYKVGYAIGLLREKYPAIAQAIGLDRKDFLLKPQAQLLGLVKEVGVLERILGYSLRMRILHREAFCRGFLQFKREAAAPGGSLQ